MASNSGVFTIETYKIGFEPPNIPSPAVLALKLFTFIAIRSRFLLTGIQFKSSQLSQEKCGNGAVFIPANPQLSSRNCQRFFVCWSVAGSNKEAMASIFSFIEINLNL